MKIEEVPQDSKYIQDTVMRDLAYALNADGKYQTVQSVGWTPKNEALEVTLESINEECEEIAERVRRGETSPLEYYMAKNIMTLELLSDYTGIAKRKIRKHLNPNTFASLGDDTLAKYADALRMSTEQIKHLPN